MMKNKQFKLDVIAYLQNTLSRNYGYTSEQANKLIKDSEIEKSIDLFPEMMAHMSPEQLLDFVLD